MSLINFFSILIFIFSVSSFFCKDPKQAILSLWVCGLAIGGVYLSLGFEFLAVLQWLLSTAMAISFFFYSLTFGEFGAGEKEKIFPSLFLGTVVSVFFFTCIKKGLGEVEVGLIPVEKDSLDVLSRALVGEYFLSVPIFSLTLFLTMLGCGMIAREENNNK